MGLTAQTYNFCSQPSSAITLFKNTYEGGRDKLIKFTLRNYSGYHKQDLPFL